MTRHGVLRVKCLHDPTFFSCPRKLTVVETMETAAQFAQPSL